MEGRLMDNHILVPIDGGQSDSGQHNQEDFFNQQVKKINSKKHKHDSARNQSKNSNVKNIDDILSSLVALQQTFGTIHAELKTRQDAVTSVNAKPPSEKVEVFVTVIFVKLGEIDTLKETFSADVLITAKWKEPRLKLLPSEKLSLIDGSDYWDPQLYIENLFGEPKETTWSTAVEENGEVKLCQKRRLKATFIETIELARFPFDTQDLHITIKSSHPENLVSLHSDRHSESSINMESFVDQQEWQLFSNIETTELSGSPHLKNPTAKRCGISVSCRARRRPGFFLWNILLVMTFICSLAFTTFSVSVDKPQNRLQLTFTLVLTMVTFKFIVNNSLPKISYLTYLDKYVLLSMGVLITIGVWHAIMGAVVEQEDLTVVKRVDRIALILIGLLYISYNVIFAVFVYMKKEYAHLMSHNA